MQKILIARSLFFDPKILIMDEIFSNISSSDTQIICKNLLKYRPDLLVIIISHKIPKLGDFREINIRNNKIKLI